MQLILFDLDETLLDTSPLREARGRDWTYVSNNLDKASQYSSHPEQILKRLRSEGHKVGVVTRSPRWYAETLLNQFEIEVDVLVTGSDGHVPKPDPAALVAAAQEAGVSPSEAAYVGDDAVDHEAAARAEMTSIGAIWAIEGARAERWQRHWPDLAIREPKWLLEPDQWTLQRLAVEVALAGKEPLIHWGSVVPYEEGMSLGRYFDTKDRRAGSHALSKAILANKSTYEDAASFIVGARAVLSRLRDRLGGAIVTSVPPHTDVDFDRFKLLRAAAAAELDGEDRPDLLHEKHAVENYKYQGPEERAANNEGRFEARDVPPGARVLVIDDVYTFGGTLRSCQKALLQAGAAKAYGLTLAHTQESLLENCPECGSALKLFTGRRGRFVGCTAYWTSGCPFTKDVEE